MIAPFRTPKRHVWLDRVESLRETLLVHANEAENSATLAQPAVDALRAAGLFSLNVPAELGGTEADPMLQMEVIEALSYIHPAAGWCAMISNGTTGVAAAYLPDAGVEQIFAQGQIPVITSSFHPAGTAKPLNDGYQVNGRWRFGSGIRHSEWILAGAIVVREETDPPMPKGTPPEAIQVAVPRAAVEIHDNWQVMGLKGTGSCDFSVHDHFVPAALTLQNRLVPEPQRGGPMYRLAIPASIALQHIGFALGVARRALDELVTMATTTRGQYRPNALSERQVVHRIIGAQDLQLNAARALAFELYDEIWQRLCREEPIDPGQQLQSRAIATYVTELAVEIATQAFRYGGGGALFQPNIFELLLRDSNAAAQHMMTTDAAYEEYGKWLLGITDDQTRTT